MQEIPRLREIRRVLDACHRLRSERDQLIRKADGSERKVAQAAGVSPARVHQIRKAA